MAAKQSFRQADGLGGYHVCMRVIAGEYRSRSLRAPSGMSTRPTTDRLRETLFNVLGRHLDGARFLDLYAGSGANGIEALSRGALHSVFVEQAPPALAAIRDNLAQLKIDARRYTVEAQAVTTWLRRAVDRSGGRAPGKLLFDVIFLDPPYDQANAYTDTLLLLSQAAAGLLAAGAVVAVEHRRQTRPENSPAAAECYGALQRTRVLEQGDAALSFYKLREDHTEVAEPFSASDCS